MTDTEVEEPIDLIDDLLACSNDPLRFVELAFPHIQPESWQRKVMIHIRDELNANTRLKVRLHPHCEKPWIAAYEASHG